MVRRRRRFGTDSERQAERCRGAPRSAPVVAPERAATGRVVGKHFCVEVREDLLDHHGVLDTSDDPQCPAAGRTGLDVDTKNRLQQLHLGYRMRTLVGNLLLAVQQPNSEPGVSGKSRT